MINKKQILNVVGIAFMAMTFTMCQKPVESVPSTPKEALAELLAGNERYVNEDCLNPHGDMERVEETAPH